MKKIGFALVSHHKPDQQYESLLKRLRQFPNTVIFNELHKQKCDWYVNLSTELSTYLANINQEDDINVCPSELIFQKILTNAGTFNHCTDNFRFIDWENSQNWHPNTLTLDHLQKIQNSGALFARKFADGKSNELIQAIDNMILSQI
jgi:hypothetical protein